MILQLKLSKIFLVHLLQSDLSHIFSETIAVTNLIASLNQVPNFPSMNSSFPLLLCFMPTPPPVLLLLSHLKMFHPNAS